MKKLGKYVGVEAVVRQMSNTGAHIVYRGKSTKETGRCVVAVKTMNGFRTVDGHEAPSLGELPTLAERTARRHHQALVTGRPLKDIK